MNILITGIHGFVGNNLVVALKNQHTIYGLDIVSPQKDWFLTTNASKFIYFSSAKAAADQVEGEILTEDVIPKPKEPYGESKMLAENYLQSQKSEVGSQKFSNSGLRSSVFRQKSLHPSPLYDSWSR